MSLVLDFICPLRNGVHARPASALEEVARTFGSEIILTNRRNGQTANAKSVLAIVGADIRQNDVCDLSISGTDEAEARNALSRFLTQDFPRCDEATPPSSTGAKMGQAPLPSALKETTATIRRGTPVVGRIGLGRIVQAGNLRVPDAIPLNGTTDPAAEVQAIDGALSSLIKYYDERLTEHASTVEKDLLKAHQSMARDPEFRGQLLASLKQSDRTAAGAIAATEQYFTSNLGASESALLRERVPDIRDVCFQLLRQVYGTEATMADLQLLDDSIVVADSLTPGQFLQLDRAKLKGLVIGQAGTTSHTVILARSFGIPTIVGVTGVAAANLHGQDAIVDGDAGLLVTDLTETVRKFYQAKRDLWSTRFTHQAYSLRAPGTTSDGQRVEVAGNITTAAEAGAVFASGAEAIGLFRTEMLFLDRNAAPSEAEQFEEYRKSLEAAGDRTVIIRTVDIGGDKPLPYLNLPTEENPFLGYRAVRIYPEFESLFRTQIRALVRASVHGQLKVMIPMVASIKEVRWVRQIIREEQKRCTDEGIGFNEAMPIGAMIEIPSAAFLIDKLCAELDFFSIGSNDLAQFFTAADRSNVRLTQLHDQLQPAFLRLLKKIVDDVHANGKQVGLCGEMGAQSECLPLLIGLGLDEISVGSLSALKVKGELGTWSAAACRELIHRALDCATATEVRELVKLYAAQRQMPLVAPEMIVTAAACQTKAEAIKQAVDHLYIMGRTEQPDELEQGIWQREAAYSTGFGHGFAIPHCKSDAILSNSLVILKLRTAVDWESLDHQPVDVIILMAIREADQASGHMKIFSQLARKVMDEAFREKITSEADPVALCAFLKASLNT